MQFEIRAEENKTSGKKSLVGMPIVYGQVIQYGWRREVIDAGAIDANTDLKDVRFLIGHNTSMVPLARSRNNNENSTMQLSVTERGMEIRVDLDIDGNPRAAELYSAVKRGDISGMSFMMIGVKDRWENARGAHPTRHVIGIGRIGEISAVTHPAYAQTSIENRGISGSLDSALESLESARAAEKAEERKRKAAAILALKNMGGKDHDDGRTERERS
jgi:HK97 family phage prohead protease